MRRTSEITVGGGDVEGNVQPASTRQVPSPLDLFLHLIDRRAKYERRHERKSLGAPSRSKIFNRLPGFIQRENSSFMKTAFNLYSVGLNGNGVNLTQSAGTTPSNNSNNLNANLQVHGSAKKNSGAE